MATQKCKDCGGEVSGEAKTCPHCGATGPGGEVSNGLFIVILGVIFVPIGLLILGVTVVPMVALGRW